MENTNHYISIEDLPDEVLEFILSFLPPYKDIQDCMFVSKRWYISAQNVIKAKERNLHKAISDFDIQWETLTPPSFSPAITKRYSHSATIHKNTMYVFGGCTCSMTTFNDLWRFDLSRRQWIRPLTMGTYPSPKACSTMVCYKDILVLFGGWTYPPTYPLHQSWNLFNELHTYDIKANMWSCIHSPVTPPPTAGHSVTVHGPWMVVFGGLQRTSNDVHSTKSNDIWKLNLETWTWFHQETKGHIKPQERYGQSQTILDDENILIMGGSGGPSLYFSDVWILQMKGHVWKWKELTTLNKEYAPVNLWCNPVCKVGNKIIVLSKSRSTTSSQNMFISRGVWLPPRANAVDEFSRNQHRIDMAARAVDRDENVNGKRGTLKSVRRYIAAIDELTSKANPNPHKSSDKDNEHPGFRKANNNARSYFADSLFKKKSDRDPLITKKNGMSMYVLDITHALDEDPFVTWLPCSDGSLQGNGPDETVLYTLVSGKSELIMFGGIQKDINELVICSANLNSQVCNSVHFITAPRYII